MTYDKHINTRKSPQTERTPGRTDEVKNSAGGFVHKLNDWDRLDRFLILGTEGGTYYVGERELTQDNFHHIAALIREDGVRVVRRVVDVSRAGRAHKNEAALFVLAAALKTGDDQTRKLASGVMPLVARTGTHLFSVAKYIELFGGWGRATKRAFQNWYNSKTPDQLAYQLLKYQQRNGWSHRDILRLAHPVTTSQAHRAMFDVTCRPEKLENHLTELPSIYAGYEKAQKLSQYPDVDLIEQYNLSWEMLPTEWLNDKAVNKALLKTMPLMATIRQLGRLSSNGTLKPLSEEVDIVCERLTNDEQIAKSRIHPMHYLLAVKTYEQGKGVLGNKRWDVDGRIVGALNEGFYKSFSNVEPTNKSFLIGVDVSSSMSWSYCGNGIITAAEGAAAMALVIAKTEPKHMIHGFAKEFVNLGISAKDSLSHVMKKTSLSNFGATDCALPMIYAAKNDLLVDVFVVITDNETWAGNIKPGQALKAYRQGYNRNAKLVVVGMTTTGFTIADPDDAGMLDVVGFDADVMPVISEFAR